jgi:hypothetical protein
MYLTPGEQFAWPSAPLANGGTADLQQMHATAPASGYTAHIANPAEPYAHFVAWDPRYKLAFGYIWKTADFPWMGIWEENCSRTAAPWDSKTITRGMEFGVSPFPESRRAMVERATLLDTPTFRWMPAQATLEAEYCILSRPSESILDKIDWPV